MKIDFKYSLEEKVNMKYDGRYGKTVFTVLGREYTEMIGNSPQKKYQLYGSPHEQCTVNELLIEKHVEDKKNKQVGG